jgi:fatty acyl-CoA reductase
MSVRARKNLRVPPATRRRAGFYDLDGTLVDLNLVHVAAFAMANLGEWSGRISYLLGFVARIPRLYLAERQDRRLLNTVLFEAFKGISHDRLFSLGEEYCERVMLNHLYPRAVEMLEANRAEGIEPVLVTGSPDFIAIPLSRHLGIEHVASNRLIFSRGCATGRLAEPIIAGDDKALWCTGWALENQIDLADCWGYADSHHDIAFLSAMGHPVAVNPDHKLHAAATSRQWPVIRFKANKEMKSENNFGDEIGTRGSNGAS